MAILNLTAVAVTYQLFLYGLYAVIIELLILARDVSITLFAVTVIDLLLYCFLRKTAILLRLIKFALLGVNVCMFAADLFTLYNFGLPVNTLMLEVILMSNIRESGEFLQTYLSAPNIWLFFGIIILSLVVLNYVFMMIYRHKKLLAGLVVLGMLAGIFASGREYLYMWHHKRPLKAFALPRLGFMLNEIYQGSREYQRMLDSAPKDIHITKNDGTIPYIVFVLGESTARNRMSAYGYSLKTTPLIDELVRQGRTYVFDDVISPHGLTNLSMQKMFTFYRYGDPGRWFEYTSLFQILRAAGYSTVWLSNQESSSSWKVAGFYIRDCAASMFTDRFNDSFRRGLTYDEMLLPKIDEVLRAGSPKNFFLIHLLGTHGHYHKRYPEEFAVFSPDDEAGYEGITMHQKNVRARYDNAVLHNDFILREIIRKFEDKSAIVIYVSDHGEEVYDTMNYEGHNEGLLSCSVIEVPMIIYLSQKFSDAHPELEQRIAASVHRPYMTDDIIHTVLDIAGIETDEYYSSRSVINPAFDASRPRIYAGHLYTKEAGFSALP